MGPDPSTGQPAPRRRGRPSTTDRYRDIAQRAHRSEHSVRSFFSRPATLSAQARRDIAAAAAAVGWRPAQRGHGPLANAGVGYQIPRSWSGADNSIFSAILIACLVELERAGGWLAPFMVDPEVLGYVHGQVLGPDPGIPHQDCLSDYALNLAPEVYRRVFRTRHLKAFIVNDPRTADARLKALDEDRVPYVVLGSPEHPQTRFSVDIDHVQGFEAMTAHLLAAGCRRSELAHYGFTDDGTLVPPRRRAAVARALGVREEAVPRLQRHYEATNDEHEIARLTRWLADQEPQAVVCDSDSMAALVARAAAGCGRRVRSRLGEPGALLLAGCDDAPIRQAQASTDRWMTLRQPAPLWARSTVQLLAEASSGVQPRHILVPPTVVDPPAPATPG